MTTAPTLTPLRCKCRAVLAATDGERLIVNGVEFRRTVSFWCVWCGQRREWVPCE